MGLAAETARRRWEETGGKDPLFAAVDGANCPSLPQDQRASHSLLLDRGLFRIFLPWPPRAADGTPLRPEFTIEVVRDPTGCNTDAVYGLTDLMEMAWQGAGRVRVPTLLLYGRRDELIPPEPVATISRRLAPVARQALYPAGWHMLLRDLQAAPSHRKKARTTTNLTAPCPPTRAPGKSRSLNSSGTPARIATPLSPLLPVGSKTCPRTSPCAASLWLSTKALPPSSACFSPWKP